MYCLYVSSICKYYWLQHHAKRLHGCKSRWECMERHMKHQRQVHTGVALFPFKSSLFMWQGPGSLWAKSWPTCWCRTGDYQSQAHPDDSLRPIIVQGLNKHTLALLDATSVGADQHLENQITSNASIPALINGRAECRGKWSSIVIVMNAAQRHCHNKFQCA